MNIVCLKFKVCAREMRFIKSKEETKGRGWEVLQGGLEKYLI